MKRSNAHEVTLRAVLEMLFMCLCPHLERRQTLRSLRASRACGVCVCVWCVCVCGNRNRASLSFIHAEKIPIVLLLLHTCRLSTNDIQHSSAFQLKHYQTISLGLVELCICV